jgi:diguanylate cyclase (GGDEF)-like protein/PAS domain S-box-containing protein
MSSARPRSLRFKLVLASVVVEVLLLALLVYNSQRLIERSLVEQAELRVTELNPLLNAALAAPLAERDYGTLQEILQASAREQGVQYLVLLDRQGRRVASVGWPGEQHLPEVYGDIQQALHAQTPRYDVSTAITLAGQQYGVLHYGLATRFLSEAKATLLRQSLIIAGAEVLLSLILLSAVGLWLTRNLARLTEASRRLSAGELDLNVQVQSDDEVGELATSFNRMASAIRERVAELAARQAEFHAIADYTYDWESWTDTKGRLLWTNPSVERLTGYTPEECLAMPDYPLPMVDEGDRDAMREALREALEMTTRAEFEFRARHKDGSVFWASMAWQPIRDAEGRPLGQRSSVRDISERKAMEITLKEQLQRLEFSEQEQKRLRLYAQQEQARLGMLLSAMNIGILFEDVERRIVYTNPAFRRIWLIPDNVDLNGMETSQVLVSSANVLSRPDHFSKHILQVLETHEVSDTIELQVADGRQLTQVSYPVRDPEGRHIGRLWLYEDVTRERQTAEQLLYLAERDSLTGLYNRHRFQEELERMLTEAERRHTEGALVLFDLDEFKHINDTFGHRAGDSMLIRVAGELGTLVRRGELLSRLGGDEFAVLMPNASEVDAIRLGERIVRAISQLPFRFQQQNLRLTTSVGIALYPTHGTDAENLIAHADSAMYQAKEAGKNAWRVYRADREAKQQIIGRLSWQERITSALENDLMRLHFQGVYRANGGELSHLEVLVRMLDQEDTSRIIMPGHFIGVAEKTGKIRDIDRWVIRESIRTLSEAPWLPALAVNISGRSFDDPALPRYIADELKHFEVDPKRLLVELTETSAVSDLHDAQRFIEALHQTGCRVCLDDFGNGFSSFAYLKHLEVEILKIDGLFIRDLPNDRDNQIFVKSIVDVARGMKKITIAEFVEDAETLNMLRQFGVDMVQGYHLDMPRGEHPAVQPPMGGSS